MNQLLVINWGDLGIKAAQFVLSFSILILVHEFGHFITARWFKCRVEKFFLFFNPWFSLWKRKKGDTEYGMGWIPLGGYVKISGMIDESMDREQMKQPPQPYEFRSKPAWQRLIIMLGGIILNIVLAILIFVFIIWIWGDKYIPSANLKYGIHADTLGQRIGLQDGDRIIAVDHDSVKKAGTVIGEIVTHEAKTLTIDRNGEIMIIPIPPDLVRKLNSNKYGGFSYIRYPLIVDSVLRKAKINSGSLMKGDKLIGFNGKPVMFNTDITGVLEKYKDTVADLVLLRNEKDTVRAQVYYDKEGMNNINFKSPEDIFGTVQVTYSFAEAIPAGFRRCWETLGKYITGIRQLFTGKAKASESVGSVISIGNIFPNSWDWQIFWTLTAIFSIILAFMNLLPIPALDGGHAFFTFLEMITGRKPSDKFLEYAQIAGFVLLLGIMAYALGLDIFRLFK
jgi:regulator of sigma E protease